jgi:ribonuclease J
MEDGDILELTRRGGRVTGKLSLNDIYVDGLSVGDIDSVVLRSRRALSRDGIVVVIVTLDRKTGKITQRPEITTMGFVDSTDSRTIVDESRDVVVRALDHGTAGSLDTNFITAKVRDALHKFYYEQTKRRPMILPFLVRV